MPGKPILVLGAVSNAQQSGLASQEQQAQQAQQRLERLARLRKAAQALAQRSGSRCLTNSACPPLWIVSMMANT